MSFRVVAGALIIGCCLVGCSAQPMADETPTPEPTVVTSPDHGRSLASLGYTNGPAELIWLPSGVELVHTADQANALIATGRGDQAGEVEAYLHQTLPGLGWRITAEGAGGLLFEQGQWHGAYATGDENWGLTVRND